MKLPLFVNTTGVSTVKSPTIMLSTGRWNIEQSHLDVSLTIYVNDSPQSDHSVIVGDTPSEVFVEAENPTGYSLWASLQLT